MWRTRASRFDTYVVNPLEEASRVTEEEPRSRDDLSGKTAHHDDSDEIAQVTNNDQSDENTGKAHDRLVPEVEKDLWDLGICPYHSRQKAQGEADNLPG
jgi:hypothetical protein